MKSVSDVKLSYVIRKIKELLAEKADKELLDAKADTAQLAEKISGQTLNWMPNGMKLSDLPYGFFAYCTKPANIPEVGLPGEELGFSYYGTIFGANIGNYLAYNYVDVFGNHAVLHTHNGNRYWKLTEHTGHTHDDRYYTASQVDSKLASIGSGGSAGMLQEFSQTVNATTYTHSGIASKLYIVTIDTTNGYTSIPVDYMAVAAVGGSMSFSFFSNSTNGPVHSTLTVTISGNTVKFQSNVYKIKHIRGLY